MGGLCPACGLPFHRAPPGEAFQVLGPIEGLCIFCWKDANAVEDAITRDPFDEPSRAQAKAINFAALYGGGIATLDDVRKAAGFPPIKPWWER